MTKKQRILVYPDDVVELTGKSYKYCRTLLSDLKQELGKDPKHHITCCELGEYLNLDPQVIFKSINNLPLLD